MQLISKYWAHLVSYSFPPFYADLPTAVAPSTAPSDGDWIALISGYIKDGALSSWLSCCSAWFSLGRVCWLCEIQRSTPRKSRMGRSRGASCRRCCSFDFRELPTHRSFKDFLSHE